MAPVSKRIWLTSLADKRVKATSFVSRILTCVCVLLILISLLITNTTHLENIPAVGVVLNLTEMPSVPRFVQELDAGVRQLDYELKTYGSTLPLQTEEFLRDAVDQLYELVDNFSFWNVRGLTSLLDDMPGDVNTMIRNSFGLYSKDLDNIALFLNAAMLVLTAIFLLFAALSALGGFFRSTVLTVISLVLNTPFMLFFFPTAMLVLVVLAHISLIITLVIVNSSYKEYVSNLP